MEFEEGFKATDTEAIEKAGLNKQYVLHPIHYSCFYRHIAQRSPLFPIVTLPSSLPLCLTNKCLSKALCIAIPIPLIS